MSLDTLDLRRKMLNLTNPGDCVTMQGDATAIAAAARRFSTSRRIPVKIEATADGATITRGKSRSGTGSYPQIADLEPGESVLIQAPVAEHQRVRLAASQYGAKCGQQFSCKRIGESIEVTRFGGDKPARTPRWPMDGLERGERLTFSAAPADHHKIRLAAHRLAVKTGWTIRCRLQDDGTMLVYRTDYQPNASSAATGDSIP